MQNPQQTGRGGQVKDVVRGRRVFFKSLWKELNGSFMSHTLCLLTAPLKYLFDILLAQLHLQNKRPVGVLMPLFWPCRVVIMREHPLRETFQQGGNSAACPVMNLPGEFRRGVGSRGKQTLANLGGPSSPRAGLNRLLSVQIPSLLQGDTMCKPTWSWGDSLMAKFAFRSPPVSGGKRKKKYKKLLFGLRKKKRNFPSPKKKPLKKFLCEVLIPTYKENKNGINSCRKHETLRPDEY